MEQRTTQGGKTLGRRIAENRKRLGLTQDQLAERMGVSPQAVSKWENDLSCPDITALPRLAEIFGMTTDQLLGVASEEPVRQGEIVDDTEDGADEDDGRGVTFTLGSQSVHMSAGRRGGIAFALWVIFTGGMLLAAHFLKADVGFWTALWTTGLLALGIHGLLRRFSLFSLTLSLGGLYFILNTLTVIPDVLSWKIVLPALLLVWGLSLLADSLRKKNDQTKVTVRHPKVEKGRGKHTVENGWISYSDSFGEDRYTVETSLFRGGEVDVSFGEHTIDLTRCGDFAPDAALEVNASFGEVIVLVPRWCRVEMEESKAFASIEVSGQPDAGARCVLRIDASVSFGEIKLCYV